MPTNALSLSQFQQLLGNTIRMNRDLQNVWVQAELSDVRTSGNHVYMELIEKDTAGTTRAKLRAMIWNGTQQMLRRKFYDTTGRDIANGMKVLVCGSVNHHNIYGLSFTITDIDPTYTLGDMERLRREILERLSREGLLDLNKSLEVPIAPQKIAVISAENAAGYGDFMNQIDTNPDGFAIYTMLFPAMMQGEKTVPTVMDALDKVELTAGMWDAVAIIRGGGATTDLNAFDNYELARRIATFPIPVMVGIGHERDRTVLDEIACVRCKTPTAVAAYIIDSLRNAYAVTSDCMRRIAAFCTDAMKGEQMRLSNISQALPIKAENVLMRAKMKLNTLAQSLPNLTGSRVMKQQMALSGYANTIERIVAAAMHGEKNRLGQLGLKLQTTSSNFIEKESLKLQRMDDMLRLLSPQNTLRRGYSITRVNGKAVKSVSEVPGRAFLEIELADGKISANTCLMID